MSMYAIQDTTLTALGDAVRSKVIGQNELPYVSDTFTTTTSYVDKVVLPYEFPIGVKKIKLIINLESEFPYDNVYLPLIYYTPRYTTADGGDWVEVPPRDTSIFPYEVMLNGNVFTIRTSPASTAEYNVSYSYTAIGLDENGNEFKYTPLEMVDKINGLMTIPDEAFYLTGDKSYAFQRNNNKWMINSYGDKITTDKLTNIGYMFQYSDGLTAIPFDLNIDSSKTNVYSPNLFQSCNNLKEAPLINNYYVYTCNGMFSNCYNLHNLPVGFAENWDFSGIHNSTNNSLASFFNNCYSLREVPEVLRKNLWNKSTASYSSGYNYGFNSCYSLDELTDLGITTASLTSNVFGGTFQYTYRLAELTFEVNEDGTPKTANWKSQTIDLSKYIGYIDGNASNVTNYNSGITADKEVKDDASYQALKNDPDWFSCDVNYSRYNHDSAVNTINSLPDCSSSGGTNTIKFKGASGALTDGGAINTLTEEEIAVATAKSWTVSLV